MIDRRPFSAPLLLALFCSVLTAALDIAMMGPAFPAIQAWFKIDAGRVAWVSATFTLCSLAGVPVMGWLADTRDRKAVLLLAISVFLVGATVVVTAESFAVLLAGRGLQGLAAAGIFPIVSAVVGDGFRESDRGKALGVLGAVFGLAFIVGPALAGILIRYDWRWLFAIAIPLAIIAMLLVWRFVPANRVAAQGGSLDIRGLLVFVVAVGCLAFALNGLDADSIAGSLRSARILVPLGILVVLVPVFVATERRAVRPVVRLTLFKNPDVRLAVLMAVGAGMCEAAMIFTPSFAVAAHGVDQSTASFMFIPLALAVSIGSPTLGRSIDRIGVRSVTAISATLLFAGLVTLLVSTGSLFAFYAGSVSVGFGLAGLLGSALNYLMLLASGPGERTTAQGFVTLALNTGLSLGATVVGAIIATSVTPVAGFRVAFSSLAVIALCLLLLSLRLTREASPVAAEQTVD